MTSRMTALFADIPSSDPVDTKEDAEVAIDRLIKENMKQTGEVINTVVAAVFGRFGQSQDAIPQSMRRGGVSSKLTDATTRIVIGTQLT